MKCILFEWSFPLSSLACRFQYQGTHLTSITPREVYSCLRQVFSRAWAAGRGDGKKFPKRTNNSELDIRWDASAIQTGNSMEQLISAFELCVEYTCLAALAFIS